MIVKIQPSPLKNKRYRVWVDTRYGMKSYDFGLRGGETYIDHQDKLKRKNYRARHLANEKEFIFINELIPSPALFSFFLLWGEYPTLEQNIHELNRLWSIKHAKRLQQN